MADPMENTRIIPGMTDTHFHSAAMVAKGLPIEDILHALKSGRAGLLVDVAIRPDDLDQRKQVTKRYDNIVYSSGIHPSVTDDPAADLLLDTVRDHVSSGVVVAVGETGLDWYRMYAPRERQLRLFDIHLQIASEFRRPVVIHNREADEDVYNCLKQYDMPASGVMHCFSSDERWAERFLDLGMYISFAGNITFRNADNLRRALAVVPLDRILLETDAPFLAPAPMRGHPNHPGYIGHIYDFVSQQLNLDITTLVDVVAQNARRLFRA